MKDMNVAKLTSQDLLLFNGIMSDLFPGVDTPVNDYGKVKEVNNKNKLGLGLNNDCENKITLYVYLNQIFVEIPLLERALCL